MYDQRWSDDWIARRVRSHLQGSDLSPHPRRARPARVSRATRCSTSARTPGGFSGSRLTPGGRRRPRAQPADGRLRGGSHRRARPPDQRGQIPDLGRRFDAVTLTDVLEHVPEPVPSSRMCARRSRRRVDRRQGAVRAGADVKETWRASAARLSRDAGRQPRPRQSLFAGALRRALERAGFDEIALEVAAPELPSGTAGSTGCGSRCSASRSPCRAASILRSRSTCRPTRATLAAHDGPGAQRRHADLQQLKPCCGVPRGWRVPPRPATRDHRRRGRLPRRNRAFLESESETAWGRRHLRWMHQDDAHELRCTNAGLTRRARRC